MGALFSTADTIVAVATPPGHSGVGVVRLSGPSAPAIAQQLTARSEPFTPRHATLATIAAVDQVVVTWFAAPHSYTAEDVVEISTHGSPWVLQAVLQRACEAGARLAQPGEFTLRAHLNGQLDLIQAEAVADLIDAVTPLQARVAFDQLEGTLTDAIRSIDQELFDLAAKLEASLDFPDEGFHFITRTNAITDLETVERNLAQLADDGRRGRLIREGRLVVIAGRPNVGKSSLFNALVGTSRAIVTAVAGTTRDLLTEAVDVCGVPITLVDTAGLRVAADAIEEEGVRRAERARQSAALTLLILDLSQPLTADDLELLHDTQSVRVVIGNKADLPHAWTIEDARTSGAEAVTTVSAATGVGLENVRRAIVGALSGGELTREGPGDWRDPPRISNLRHLQHVQRALAAVERSLDGLRQGATEELALAELGEAREALESLTRTRTADDLLAHIFSRFCVGK